MRRILFAGLILASSAAGTSAATWNGVYGGVQAGVGSGWGTASYSSTVFNPAFVPGTINVGPMGPLAGVQAGAQGQNGVGVLGVEVDAAWAHMTGSGTVSPLRQQPNSILAGTSLTASEAINWLASARLRAGLLDGPNVLYYLTGGVMAGGVDYAVNGNVHPNGRGGYYTAPASTSKTKFGWTFGGGAEWYVASAWTLKAEALYFDLGNETLVSNLVDGSTTLPASSGTFVTNFTTKGLLLRVGFNKHF